MRTNACTKITQPKHNVNAQVAACKIAGIAPAVWWHRACWLPSEPHLLWRPAMATRCGRADGRQRRRRVPVPPPSAGSSASVPCEARHANGKVLGWLLTAGLMGSRARSRKCREREGSHLTWRLSAACGKASLRSPLASAACGFDPATRCGRR